MVGEGVIAIDTQQTIRLVNDEAERVFGYARSKLVGKTVDVLIPDAYKSRHAAAFERRLSDPSPMAVRYVEVEGRRKDGSLIPLEIRFTRSTLGAGSNPGRLRHAGCPLRDAMTGSFGRRTFLRRGAALTGSLGLLHAPRAPWVQRRPADAPDILVLVGDDIGWPDLEGFTEMPSFERHRRESLVF